MKNMSSKKYCKKAEIIIGKKWIVILAVKKAMFVCLFGLDEDKENMDSFICSFSCNPIIGQLKVLANTLTIFKTNIITETA
jgi:hypothetical protein